MTENKKLAHIAGLVRLYLCPPSRPVPSCPQARLGATHSAVVCVFLTIPIKILYAIRPAAADKLLSPPPRSPPAATLRRFVPISLISPPPQPVDPGPASTPAQAPRRDRGTLSLDESSLAWPSYSLPTPSHATPSFHSFQLSSTFPASSLLLTRSCITRPLYVLPGWSRHPNNLRVRREEGEGKGEREGGGNAGKEGALASRLHSEVQYALRVV